MTTFHRVAAGLVAAVVLPSFDRPGSVLAQVTITVEGDGGTVPIEGIAVEVIVAPAEAVMPAEGAGADGQPDGPLTPEAQRRQMILQQAAQLEPMVMQQLLADLQLLRTLEGDLPLEARRAIGKGGEIAAKETALRASEAIHTVQAQQQGPVQPDLGEMVNVVAETINGLLGIAPPAPKPAPPAEASPLPDPFDHLRSALMAGVVEHVGEEVAARFAAELSLREDRRRKTVVRRIVATLDEDLFLTSRQQEAIEAALGSEWDDGIDIAADAQMEMNGRKVYVGLPYDRVLPHLTASQQDRLGDGKESKDLLTNGHNWHFNRLWRRMNMMNFGLTTERDPWWFE